MKILHIAPTPFFSDRGCHIRILGEIKALQSQGHDIVLTTYHNGRDVEDIEIRRIINIPWYQKLEAGASWHKFYLDVLLLLTSIRTFIREKPDVIHGHLHEGALIGKLVSLLLSRGKIPVIFDVQGSLTGELETYGFFRFFKPLRYLFTLVEKLICRLPNYFVCSSESNTEFIKDRMKIPEDKVISLPDGIYPDFFKAEGDIRIRDQLGIPGTKKIIIYTGSLMRSKGIDYLLDAIPAVIKGSENVFFLIVGYPVQYCQQRVRDLGVENFVGFMGKVDYFQLPRYLSTADVAVDPKVDESGEGSGKIINYMGAGLPVVCFDTLNNRTLLEDNAFFAVAGDKENLADKILHALENEKLSEVFGERGSQKVFDKFCWLSNGETLSTIYRQAIESTMTH